jgi:thiol-disulfide isomerase/thioredoxin
MLLEPDLPCSRPSLIALLLLGTVLGACDRQSARTEQDNAATSGEVTPGEATAGNSGAAAPHYVIDRSKAGSDLPDFVFSDDKGKDVSLERFAGRPILVNLWATWCTPCVAEMPQLDRIAGAYAKNGLQVLTISQDSMGADKVLPFFNAKGFRHIKPWLDTENNFGFGYGGGVLPISVLYSGAGKEIARVSGALDWEGDEARALLEEAVGS